MDRYAVYGPLEPQATAERLMGLPLICISGNEDRLLFEKPVSPASVTVERVSPRGGTLADSAFIQGQIASVTQPVVLCGNSHIPRAVHLSDGRLIVNPGSVGLQAYTDDAPEPHAMECGSPHARYAVLSRVGDQWSIEAVSLPYAWKKAADAGRRNGRNDWAAWLERGRAA